MNVQVLTYDLGPIDEQSYIDHLNRAAPGVAAVPGLLAAVWLDGAETEMYGALLFWEDRRSMEKFKQSRLFAQIFSGFEIQGGEAAVLENVTAQTQPAMSIVGARDGGMALPSSAATTPSTPMLEAAGTGGGKTRKSIAKKAAPTKKGENAATARRAARANADTAPAKQPARKPKATGKKPTLSRKAQTSPPRKKAAQAKISSKR